MNKMSKSNADNDGISLLEVQKIPDVEQNSRNIVEGTSVIAASESTTASQTLQEKIEVNHNSLFILFQALGVCWPKNNDSFMWKLWIYFWCTFSRLYFIPVAISFPFFYQFSVNDYVIYYTFVVQAASVLPSIFGITKQLGEPSTENVVQTLVLKFKQSKHFLTVMLSFVLLYFLVDVTETAMAEEHTYSYDKYYVLIGLLTLSSISIVCYITVCLIFMLTDCSLCLDAIQSLILDHEQLTREKYTTATQHIKSIINKHYYTNHIIISVSLLDILILIFLGIYSKIQYSFYIFLMPMFVFKEIAFVTILLYHISAINENADRFKKIMCSLESYPVVQSEQAYTRMLICNHMHNVPIAYKVFGRRITKNDVFFQFLTIIVSFVVAFVRSLLLHKL